MLLTTNRIPNQDERQAERQAEQQARFKDLGNYGSF